VDIMNRYLTKFYPMILSNAVNPDPGSGVFLTLDPGSCAFLTLDSGSGTFMALDSGSGIGFFRIPDPKPIFLIA
jgi:hypothetical protein